MGIEPTTTSLPRRCSTTEPPRHLKIVLNFKSGRRESNPRGQLGRLEHYHCATPASTKWGRMDLNHRRTKSGRFTVCCTRPLCDTPTNLVLYKYKELFFKLFVTRICLLYIKSVLKVKQRPVVKNTYTTLLLLNYLLILYF